MTPNWGSERAKWKTWGRWIATNSRLKPINLFKADLGALKSKNFLPNKSTTMKSAAHPVSINRSVSELTFREFIAAVEADSWFEWLCGIATWLLDMDWHWWTITIPVENTAKKMAKIRANRLLLLTTMRMDKLYHLPFFVWLFVTGSLANCDWKYRITHSHYPWNCPTSRREIGKGPDLSRPFHAKLMQLFWPLPIDRAETVKTVVETTGFELAPIVW